MPPLTNAKRGEQIALRDEVQTITVSGPITLPSGTVILSNSGAAMAVTFARTPKPGAEFYIWHDTGTRAHTVTLPSGMTYDGTNNTATFDALNESLLIKILSSTRASVIVNNGSVALSSV